jgi:NAD(P)-dependent dehydrogenase (short-subunit alcohol dehydrogenase family)
MEHEISFAPCYDLYHEMGARPGFSFVHTARFRAEDCTDGSCVGLRSAFVASYYAAPLLIVADGALVVNVSYYGAVSYHLDPAYGATKAGLDKLTFDMAQDFKPYKVAVVSIWPGPTATERTKSVIAKMRGGDKILESAETPKFSGLAIA